MYTRFLWVVSLVCFLIACSNPENDKIAESNSFKETNTISQQIKEKPNDASLYFKRGLIYRSIVQDSLALLDFYQAVKLDSTIAKYHSAIGELMFDHKDISSSVKWIQKAIHPGKKGALKKALDVPTGQKIPSKKLAMAAKKGGKLGQRARLAMTLRKLKESF